MGREQSWWVPAATPPGSGSFFPENPFARSPRGRFDTQLPIARIALVRGSLRTTGD
jgi:hypothetical protein